MRPTPTPSPVRLDTAQRSVVIWCTQCPPYRRLTASRAAGHLEAAAHADAVHNNAAAAAEHRRRARNTQ